MPPNKKGGKNYKKGKHVTDEPIVYERLEDQMYGRVLKLLGGCNALVYCNDNKERLCHIRGSMRKKVWIATGDIVLISVRDFDTITSTKSTDIGRGDICARYDPKVIYRIREKDKTINERLFINIEKSDGSGNIEVQGGFEFENGESDLSSESDSESDSDKKRMPSNRTAQKRAMMVDNDDNDGEINIDDI